MREAGIPVVYSRNVAKRTVKFDMFQTKAGWDHSRTLDGEPGTMIVEALSPEPEDIVVDKSYASIFWGTPLLTYLVALKVDSLIVTGVSTSGCVRATLVDGITHGFAGAVVEDATADRVKASHKVALLDIWMKYADVMTSSDVEEYVTLLREEVPLHG
jgi:nicotinamidase-related amidase